MRGHLETAIGELMTSWLTRSPAAAREHCADGRTGNEHNCADYHAVRPFLYCAGLKTSFGTYQRIFGASVPRCVAGRSAPRALISGAADFLVPALVAGSLQDSGGRPNLTIVDRCRTPLEMCKSAGRHLGMTWQLSQGDVRRHQPSTGYDLIVTDRLFGFFPSSQRAGMVDAWYRQLNAGGRLLATISIRPDGAASRTDNKSLLNYIRDRYTREYRDLLPGVTRDELLQMVENYIDQRCCHRVCGPNEVLPLFESSGLTVIEARKFRKKTEAGLRVASTRYILRVIAEKPG